MQPKKEILMIKQYFCNFIDTHPTEYKMTSCRNSGVTIDYTYDENHKQSSKPLSSITSSLHENRWSISSWTLKIDLATIEKTSYQTFLCGRHYSLLLNSLFNFVFLWITHCFDREINVVIYQLMVQNPFFCPPRKLSTRGKQSRNKLQIN